MVEQPVDTLSFEAPIEFVEFGGDFPDGNWRRLEDHTGKAIQTASEWPVTSQWNIVKSPVFDGGREVADPFPDAGKPLEISHDTGESIDGDVNRFAINCLDSKVSVLDGEGVEMSVLNRSEVYKSVVVNCRRDEQHSTVGEEYPHGPVHTLCGTSRPVFESVNLGNFVEAFIIINDIFDSIRPR